MGSDTKYCRICLDDNFVGQSIFEIYNCKSLPEIVMTISGVKIYKMDKYSQLICFNCAELLVKAIEAIEKCLESDRILNQYQYGLITSTEPLPEVKENINYERSVIDYDINKTTTEELWHKIVNESSEASEQFSKTNNNSQSIELEKEFEEFITNLISDTDDNDIQFKNSLNTDDNCCNTSEYDWGTSSSVENFNSNIYYDEGERRIITTNNNQKIIKTKTNQIYKCEHCMKIIKNRTAYERHKRYHLQQKQEQLNNINHKTLYSNCQKYLTHNSNFKHHLLVRRNKKMDLICIKCNEKFTEPNKLYEHLKTHQVICSTKNNNSISNNIDNNYICSCKKINVTATEDSINNNLFNSTGLHDDKTEYILKCKLCKNYKTASLTLYSQHMRQKHQINDTKPFKCNICEMTFASKQGMFRHIDNIHENNRKNLRNREKKFLCNTCGKFFYTNFHLEIHIRSHTGEKPFKCPFCEKGFAQMSGLRMHTLIHTKERPYPCKICGKCFTQYGHVKEHYLIHSNEKNHVCNVCGHSFRVKGNLTAHMLVHSDKKPFSCGHCGKEFIQRTKLRAHVSKYHQPEYSDDNDDSNDNDDGTANSLEANNYFDKGYKVGEDNAIERPDIKLQICVTK